VAAPAIGRCRASGRERRALIDFPLDALHQDLRVAELEQVHDRHHLMAAHSSPGAVRATL